MKKIRSVSVSLMLMSCLGMLFPPVALGDSPVAKRQSQRALDVSLHDGGLLVGQVVNPQGETLGDVEVAILREGHELVRTKTDELGRFAIKGVQDGVYQLATTGSQLPVRAWSSKIAPPSSARGAMLVEGTTVRGQCKCNGGAAHVGSYGGAASFNQGAGEAASFNQGGGRAASFNQGGGEAASVNQRAGEAASFNQGGAAGGNYGGEVVNYGEAGASYADPGVTYENASAATSGGEVAACHGDAGASYVDGSSGYYDGGAAAGGGYGAGAGYGGGHGAGGGLFGGGGGIFSGGGGVFSGGGAGILSSPWIIGAGVAAAIAIPVALDDDDAS